MDARAVCDFTVAVQPPHSRLPGLSPSEAQLGHYDGGHPGATSAHAELGPPAQPAGGRSDLRQLLREFVEHHKVKVSRAFGPMVTPYLCLRPREPGLRGP